MAKNYKSRETMLVITVGFLLLHLAFTKKIFLSMALVVGLTGVLSGYLSDVIDVAWTRLSLLLGKISNAVLLTLIFFLVLTPMGLIRRLFAKGRLVYFDKDKTSNLSARDHSFAKKDLENTW